MTDANAVRWVLAGLSPFAPGCAGLAIGDRARILSTLATPADAMALLLARLHRPANTVRAQALAGGDVGLLALTDPARGYPLAFIADGLDEAEAREALMTCASAAARARTAA
jgi:hypothetical protein